MNKYRKEWEGQISLERAFQIQKSTNAKTLWSKRGLGVTLRRPVDVWWRDDSRGQVQVGHQMREVLQATARTSLSFCM